MNNEPRSAMAMRAIHWILPSTVALLAVLVIFDILSSNINNMQTQISQLTKSQGKLETLLTQQQALEISNATAMSGLQQNTIQILLNTTPHHR